MQRFLVERFGPGIHAELLRSNQPTFQLAFEEVLARHGTTPTGAFEDFQPWFDAKVEGGIDAEPELRSYPLYFAHSARGSGWRTDLVLLNPYDKRAVANLEIYDAVGNRITDSFRLEAQGTVEYELPETPGVAVETGGLAVISRGRRLGGFLRFRHGATAFSVQASPTSQAFMVPVSEAVDRVGVAVFNPNDDDVTVSFTSGAYTVHRDIPAPGKLARFADELFDIGDIGDTLVVATEHGKITVLALEQVGSSLVTLPATPR